MTIEMNYEEEEDRAWLIFRSHFEIYEMKWNGSIDFPFKPFNTWRDAGQQTGSCLIPCQYPNKIFIEINRTFPIFYFTTESKGKITDTETYAFN